MLELALVLALVIGALLIVIRRILHGFGGNEGPSVSNCPCGCDRCGCGASMCMPESTGGTGGESIGSGDRGGDSRENKVATGGKDA